MTAPPVPVPALPGRYHVLDFYRYIAAMGVAIYHLREIAPGESLNAVFRGGFGYCVDFFFILSGFIIAHVYGESIGTGRDYLLFQAKRLARVYPLHLATLLVFVVIALAEGRPLTQMAAPLLANLTLTQAWGTQAALDFNTPSWSISAEFFCYLLFPFLVPRVARLPLVISAGVALLAYAALRSPLAVFFKSGLNGANADFGMLRALIFFVIGMVVRETARRVPYRAGWLLALGAAAFAGAFASMILWRKPDLIMACCTLAVLATAMGEEAFRFAVPGRRIFGFLGDLSYALYMIHMPVIVLILAPLWPQAKATGLSLSGYIVVSLVLISLLSIPVYRHYENPARRWLTNLAQRKLMPAGDADKAPKKD